MSLKARHRKLGWLLRGSLCQTVCVFFVLEATFLIQVYMKCTSPDCHHTEYHTPAYEYVDAEALLVRIRARAAIASVLKCMVIRDMVALRVFMPSISLL